MRQLTDDGRMALEGVAQRNGMSFDAVTTMLDAVDRGNGTQAQFSHPEFGGMGQWSQGGMIMIGDMFNNGLKYRVEQLCNELSNLRQSRELFVPMPALGTGISSGWWPADCGSPSSTGSQNDLQYALFPSTRRLAIRFADQVRVYDTGNHQIGGFSQQQGGDSQNLTFTSQFGTVRLYDLPMISGTLPTAPAPVSQPAFGNSGQWQSGGGQMQSQGNGISWQTPSFSAPTPAQVYEPAPVAQQQPITQAIITPAPFMPTEPVMAPVIPDVQMTSQGGGNFAPPANDDDIFAKIERLHALHTKGILSEAEFSTKKKDLLDRL